jgi:acetyl-CoA acyltransferase
VETREVVIAGAVRTPIGRGYREKGYYGSVHPLDLLARCYAEVLERSGVAPSDVDDVIAGCVMTYGEENYNVARNAWLHAGLPAEVPATTVDRQCGSGQQAVNFAAALIASGVNDVIVAGGVEHLGRNPMVDPFDGPTGAAWPPELVKKWNLADQMVGAERIAERWDIPREEMDELALISHQRAAQATREGRFSAEMVPISVGDETLTTDQGIRPNTTLESVAALAPLWGGRLTAATASQLSDGASALVLASREKADELGLVARAVIVDQAVVGVDPAIMLSGPIPATRKILERNGMTIDDVDLIEINEAFASVVAAWRKEVDVDLDRINVNGGAMALGHPLGCTGSRLITTLLHELERSDKEIGLVTMCCGGGLGTATLIRRVG